MNSGNVGCRVRVDIHYVTSERLILKYIVHLFEELHNSNTTFLKMQKIVLNHKKKKKKTIIKSEGMCN